MSDDSLAPLTIQTAPRNAQVLMEQTSHTLRTLAYDLGRLTSGEQMLAWHPLTHQQRAELVLVGLQEWDKQNPGAYAGPAITPGPQPQQSVQPQETAAPMNQPPPYPPQQFQQPPQQPQFQQPQFQQQASQQPGFGQQQAPQGYGAPQPGFGPPQAPQQAPQYAPPQAPQGGPPPPPAFTPQAQPYPQQQVAPMMQQQMAPQYPQGNFPQQPAAGQLQAPQLQQPPSFQPNGAPRPAGFQPPAIVPPPQPATPPQAPPMQQQPMFPAPAGAPQGFAGAETEALGKTRGKREPKAAAAGASGDLLQLLTNLTALVQQQGEEIAVLKRLAGVAAAGAVTTYCSTYGTRDAAAALQSLLNEGSVITQQLTPGKD